MLTSSVGAPDSTKAPDASLAYQRPTKDQLVLDGTMNGHAVRMELSFRDPDSFPLRSRGFHWVQELPFNR